MWKGLKKNLVKVSCGSHHIIWSLVHELWLVWCLLCLSKKGMYKGSWAVRTIVGKLQVHQPRVRNRFWNIETQSDFCIDNNRCFATTISPMFSPLDKLVELLGASFAQRLPECAAGSSHPLLSSQSTKSRRARITMVVRIKKGWMNQILPPTG